MSNTALPAKELFYDWGGANVWLFKQINALHGETYDAVMLFLSGLGDHHRFLYYLAAFAAWIPVSLLVRKLRGKTATRHYLAAWVGVFTVLAAGYVAEGVLIQYAKDYFSYPRPYVALAGEHVRVLEQRSGEEHHSLPSGHAAFITLMIAGLWPLLSKDFRWLGVWLIAAVCWARVALGVHFPADVMAGVLIGLAVVILLRMLIYWLLFKLLRLTC